jgi:NADP-dependent 3-hydroxy acid dehydrogenase YdfG
MVIGNDQRVAIVSGAAGGIGAAVSRELAAGGARVGLLDRDADRLDQAVHACGPTAYGIQADITDFAAVRAAVAEFVRRWGAVDVVVACAGVHDQSTLDAGDPAWWRPVLETNVLGVAHLIRATLPGMYRRRQGHIVVVASVSGRVTYQGESLYVASKHAAVALVDCLRQEASPRGVRTTLIEPGLVDTSMLQDNAFADGLLETVTPLRPEDCARAVRFALDQPPNCAVNEIVLRPVGQLL